ncbi:hypothetical protein ACHAWF_000828 [Thalassiosira exigua]
MAPRNRHLRARVVLVGVGTMGQIRAAAVSANPKFDLAGIIDIDLPAAEKLAAKHSTEAFQSFDQVVGRFGLQEKLPKALASIEAQKKNSQTHGTSDPPSVSLRSMDLLYSSKSQLPCCLMKFKSSLRCAHTTMCRCAAGFSGDLTIATYVAAAEALQGGAIGKPLSAQIFLLAGGNIFFDLCIHDVDFIRWALQDEVESVFATATYSNSELKRSGIHDNATMVLSFRRGALVTLNLSRHSCYGYDQRCDIWE